MAANSYLVSDLFIFPFRGVPTIFILDIEASGLAEESYPIEIAWCSLDESESYQALINPETAGDWEYWDGFAETAIHGLSREHCCKEGKSVLTIAQAVGNLLREESVLSDAHWQDQIWLERLFEAVGKRPPGKLKPIDQAVTQDQRALLTEKLATSSRPHRALADCQLLARIVRELRSDI